MLRNRAIACAVAACGLAGWVAFLALRPSSPEDPDMWIVAEPDRDLGELPLGTHPVTFRLTNPAGTPRRVIGFAEG